MRRPIEILDQLFDTSPRDLYQRIYKKLFKNPSITGFDELHPCVFVLSTGRVGTMTLARLLSLTSNMFVLHEPKPSLYELSKANYHHDFGALEFSDNIFWSLRKDLIGAALKMGCGYVETSPQSTFFAPAIFKSIPSVKFIHLVRHPAEVVISGMRRNWYGGHPADKTRISPRVDSDYYGIWHDLSRFDKNAWLWSETNKWISSFLESIPENQHIRVHSESLYNNDPIVIDEIFRFLGAEKPTEKRVQHVLSRKYNRQIRGDFPRLVDWQPEMISHLRQICGAESKILGYDF